jgi:hypothetical protein
MREAPRISLKITAMKFISILKISLLPLLLSNTIHAQVNVYMGQKDLTYPQKGGIYETADDLINDKIKDVGVYNEALSKLKLGFQTGAHDREVNFGKTYYKKAGATFFGYKDDEGNRHRIIKGGDYVVLSAGEKWLYSDVFYCNKYLPTGTRARPVHGDKIERSGAYSTVSLWYANGVDGELIKIKKWDKTPSKEANEKLFITDSEISQQYLSDKKEEYDPYNKDSHMDQIERIIFYTELYNKKHK